MPFLFSSLLPNPLSPLFSLLLIFPTFLPLLSLSILPSFLFPFTPLFSLLLILPFYLSSFLFILPIFLFIVFRPIVFLSSIFLLARSLCFLYFTRPPLLFFIFVITPSFLHLWVYPTNSGNKGIGKPFTK